MQFHVAMKRCKLCLSTNIRRSGLHAAALRAHPLQLPYRCADCDSRYWVVSGRARLTAMAGACVGIAFALAVGPGLVERRAAPPAPRIDWVSAPRTEGLVPAMLVQGADARSPAAELRQGAMLPPLTSPPGLERMD